MYCLWINCFILCTAVPNDQGNPGTPSMLDWGGGALRMVIIIGWDDQILDHLLSAESWGIDAVLHVPD